MLIGFWDRANAATLLGLLLALLAMACAISGEAGWAMICLAWSGTCDLFDGFLARTIRDKRCAVAEAFGSQLDSIADMASFGVAPSVLLRCLWLRHPLDLALLALYVSCAAVRLAFFNALAVRNTNPAPPAHFRGLPVTFAAWIFPAALLLLSWIGSEELLHVAVRLLVVAVALLFVLDVRVPRPGLRARLLLAGATIALTIAWW